MKPPPFAYRAPADVDEVLALLGEHGDAAKLLAGGQSLVPAMNFRLVQPAVLVDLNRIDRLSYIEPAANGGVRIGAMTRQRAVERSRLVAERLPLLYETMPAIAHPQIRNRGTFGGSLAHADPAAELPAVALALDAELRVKSQSGERTVCSGDFFQGLFATALEPEELLTEVVLPPAPARSGFAFVELARRHGDYALVGVAVAIELDSAGACSSARIVLMSVGERPVLAERAAAALAGETPDGAVLVAAAAAAGEEIDPPADIHASAAYRRHLATVLTRRALTTAVERARSG